MVEKKSKIAFIIIIILLNLIEKVTDWRYFAHLSNIEEKIDWFQR